ncbi:MAG: hypothetical protein Fur007_14640 [Rhodoferax sp.]
MQQACHKLARLLETDDFAAGDALRAHQSRLVSVWGQALAPLMQTVEAFDFESARTRLAELAAHKGLDLSKNSL